MPKARHSGPVGVSKIYNDDTTSSEAMKPTPLPRHMNLAAKSVTLKTAREERNEARIMKLWREEDSVIETELQGLETEYAIRRLDIWQTPAGFYITIKFSRTPNEIFLAVRRKRNGPRIFKDMNRLVDFMGTAMPRVEDVGLHLLPIDERPKVAHLVKKPAKHMGKSTKSPRKVAKKPVTKTAKKPTKTKVMRK